MTLQTEKFIRKARPVEAVLVTEDNIHEVVGWCQGLYVPPNGLGGDNKEPYIHVSVINPRHESDKQAFVGMWIVREDFRRLRVITGKQLKNSYDPVAKPKPAAPSPSTMPQRQPEVTQTGAVEVVPGTPPDENQSKPLTTGTVQVNRSAESGEFVTAAEAENNPSTTVTETIVKENIVTSNEFNHDALASGAPDEPMTEDMAIADVVPGDMVDHEQPETDPDGTVQLGVPIEDATLEQSESDDAPTEVSLCGQCGSQVVDGVCSKDIEHDVHFTPDDE